jgi:hypothetical protein
MSPLRRLKARSAYKAVTSRTERCVFVGSWPLHFQEHPKRKERAESSSPPFRHSDWLSLLSPSPCDAE